MISTADVVAAGRRGGGHGGRVRRRRPGDAGAADAPPTTAAEEDLVRPSGTPRVGRARRSGLLPARLKAKRPDEDVAPVGEPLAAEPPGASVADVPGAGRRKPGLAGLAAADRAADQEQGHEAAAVPDVMPADEARPRSHGPAAGSAGRRIVRAAAAVQRRLHPRGDRRRPAAIRPAPDAGAGPTSRSGGSTGLRIGTGVAVAVVALLAFKIGTVTALILCLLVVTFAAGEAFAVLKRAGWRPATLLGLVGTISLMVGAYNKGIAALPLILVLITAFTLLWYLFGVERGSAVAGTASTLLVVGWVGPPRLLRRPPPRPVHLPEPPRDRLPAGGHHRHRGQRRRRPRRRPMDREPPARPRRQPQQDLGGSGRRGAGLDPGVDGRRRGHPPLVAGQRRPPRRGGGRRRPARATCASRCSSGTCG